MGFIDRLQKAGDTGLAGTSYNFIDADTLSDDKGGKYRIQGVNAAETDKLVNGEIKEGTAGGYQSTKIIQNLANEAGFTNLVPLLDEDGNPQVDQFGRTLVDLHDETGNSFRTKLLEANTFDVNKYTREQDIVARDIAASQRTGQQLEGTYTADEFDKAAADINEAEWRGGAKLQGFKQTAINEAERALLVGAGLGDRLTSTTQVDHYDRDINNVALNPFSDSWEIGWLGAKEGAYGFLELLGTELDNKTLADIGEAGISRARQDQGDYAKILTDWKDVDGVWKGAEWLGNNAAMSLPYMITTAAAATAGAVAAPVIGTGGALAVGIGAPALVYSGQTWNEMEGEKDAGIALASGLTQASLDRLGIGAIVGKVTPNKLKSEAIKKIMKETGMTKQAANQALANASKQELAEVMGSVRDVAARQIESKKVVKELLKNAGIGSGGEALTEAGQEAIAYMAATQGSDKEFDFEELKSRLIAASIAGGALGGAFTAPKSVSDALEWNAIAGATEKAGEETRSQSQTYAEQEKAEKGYVPSINELIQETRGAIASEGIHNTIEERAKSYNETRKDKPFVDKATEAFLNAPALWRGATRSVFTPDLQARSRSARVLADMFGANLQRIYSGSNFENSKHHRVAVYKNMVSDPRQFYSALTEGKRLTPGKKQEVSKAAYDALRKAVDKDGNFDPALIPDGKHKAMIQSLGSQLNILSDKMYADQKKHNPELGYIQNYLFKYKSLNKKAVHQNRDQFERLLMSEYKMNGSEAKEITRAITDDPNVGDLEQAFSVVKGGIVPAAHKKRSLGLSENDKFTDFLENDLFANVSHAAKSAARYTAHRDYIGQNGEVVSRLLDQMQAEGVSQAEVDQVASGLQNYLDAESGNYKRPKSAAGQKFQRIQKSAMMLMTLSGLPLATISSFVELMLVNRGLTHNQIFGKEGSLKTSGEEAAKMLWRGTKEVAGTATRQDYSGPLDSQQQRLRDLGYYDWDVGAATVTGVTEVNAWQQNVYENFFKYTGLTGWTNYTRAVRASMAADYVNDHLDKVWTNRFGGGEYTRDVQASEESLRNLGLDVDGMVEIYSKTQAGIPLTPAEETLISDNMREGTFNFVNDAVALPQSQNRPLIYQDPRFALFTQFQGFIATFTANHIPKLWGEYVKRGTPAMKYNAFAVMATMIMMGFASQHLKDLIKYDEEKEKKTGANPYLDTAEYLRRGVASSGLLGVAERPLNFAFPIYEQRSDGPLDWVFNSTVGESPALGYVERVGKAGGAALQGDVGSAVRQGVKATPFVGPFSSVADKAGELASNWNFNGE